MNSMNGTTEVLVRFYLYGTDCCIAVKEYNSPAKAIIPRIGEGVYLEDIMLEDAQDHTSEPLDYDWYRVVNVFYDYSPEEDNDVYIEIIVTGVHENTSEDW